MSSKPKSLRVKDMRCTVAGCDRMQIARGVCTTHYGRMRRTGTLTTPHLDRSWFDRAMEKTRKELDCWVFLGAKNQNGYGAIKIGGTQHILSRVAFSEMVEPLIPGMFVCHKCDNPSCWNPEHLFQGSHADNMKDMALKGRAPKAHGERKHTSKLKDTDVRQIRKLLGDGISHRTIAARFNVTHSCIWNISSGRLWSRTV